MSIAVIFPGQGSQEQGMGRDIAEKYAWAMEIWEKAEKVSGLPLREIYWQGSATDMAHTNALQPALTVTCLNLWILLGQTHNNFSPLAVAGHSLGEYSALFAAGVLSLEEVIQAVSFRGKYMNECGKAGQGMAAVLKLDVLTVKKLVQKAEEISDNVLVIANYNSSTQLVVSGEQNAFDALDPLVKEAGGRIFPLAVSGAFHSPLIQSAAQKYATVLNTLQWHTPDINIYCNVTAQAENKPAKIADNMKQQMSSSVRWTEIVHNMYQDGLRHFVEIGPKNVLSKLLAQNLKDMDNVLVENIGSLDAVMQWAVVRETGANKT